LSLPDLELAEAVRADLVTMVSLLHAPPIGEVHGGAEASWFLTGIPAMHSNGVLRATLPPGAPDATIERLLEPFRSRSLPMMWWRFVPPEPSDPAVDEALRRHGLVLEADRPGFGLELEGLLEPAVPAGGSVERVRDPSALSSWIDVVGRAFDDPGFAERPSVEAFRRYGFGNDAPFRHYILRIEGSPVGAATLSLGAGVAGLGNIAVVPEARRGGVGTAVAAAALSQARELGVRIAALSADPLGVGLYRRLGFREISRHLTYVWSPEG
jgi:GNAT superfamily N-acetyltransferase